MGQTGSKAARVAQQSKPARRYPAPSAQPDITPSSSLPGATAVGSPVEAEATEDFQATNEHHLNEEPAEQKDTSYVSFTNRLMGAINNVPVDIHDRQGTPPRKTYAEREAEPEGRISGQDLYDILKARQHAEEQNSSFDVDAAADRYSIDAGILRRTLKVLGLPHTYIAQRQEDQGLR